MKNYSSDGQSQAGKKWPQVVNHDQWRLIVVSLLSRALTAKLGATFPQLLCNIWHKKRDWGRINFPVSYLGSTILSTDGFNIGAYFVLKFKIKKRKMVGPRLRLRKDHLS